MLDENGRSLPFMSSLENAENAESRRILLRVTADHFISRERHSPQQLAQFERTMLRLLEKSDPATRLIVARKLSGHAQAPARVLTTIEDMGGEGALCVLESAALSRDRLVGAASGHVSRACALAKRADLDAELAAVLSMRPEAEILIALAANFAAPIDARTLAALARRAERDRRLADALLSRPFSGAESGVLFLLASSEQRASILAAAQRFELARVGAPARRSDHAETIAALEQFALSRQPEQFVETLAYALECETDLADRIVKEPSGEPLAVALAALDARHDVAVRILISGDLHSGANYTRIGSLLRLKDGLNRAAARRVIAALTGAQKDPRARRDPALDREAAATPSRASGARVLSSSPEALRRQRAFAFAAAHQSLPKSG
jgi:uncharacterized protein (DUF2336 family)